MYTKGLASLLTYAAKINQILGIQICKNALRIYHLFFTDDIILFYSTNGEENRRIQELLVTYEQASGQQINKAKTSIFFSKNVATRVKEEIMATWDVHKIQPLEKYLGLPSMIGKKKNRVFSDL